MAWYRTGTVTVANGSKTVTGAGTAFVANVSIGEGFHGPDGRIYEIESVVSNTSLTLVSNYQGAGASGQSYAILPTQSALQDLAAEASKLLASFASVRDGAGQGLFGDGSAALPGVRFASDQDTGMRRVATNVAALVAAGIDRLLFASDGITITGNLNPTSLLGIGTAAPVSKVHVVQGNPGLRNVATFENDASEDSWISTECRDAAAHIRAFSSSYGGGASPLGNTVALQNGSAGTAVALVGNSADAKVFAGPFGSERMRFEQGGTVRPGADNSQPFGAAAYRWSTVYAGTGAINTSDERSKEWGGDPSEAEVRAALRIIGELGTYQWLDAIGEKGEDGARIHFGVRAQRAAAIFTDEGLDPARYAWFCYDAWDDVTEPVFDTRNEIDPETGETIEIAFDTGETRVVLEAGDRYGIRPNQLAFWLIAAQAKRQDDLEDQVSALKVENSILDGRIAALEARVAALEPA